MKRFIISIVLLVSITIISITAFFEIKHSTEKIYNVLTACEKESPDSLWDTAQELFIITEKKQKLFQAFLKEDYIDDLSDIIYEMKNAYEIKDSDKFLELCKTAKIEIYELIMYEQPTIQNIL